MTVKRNNKGHLLKGGKSLNPNGAPVKTAKKVNNILNDLEIIYEKNDLEYINAHITALSKAGDHDKALQLLIETLPYRVPKISSVQSEVEEKELVITFEESGKIEEDHPLIKLLKGDMEKE